MVGDACSLPARRVASCPPTSGEGISYALNSGMLAGQAIANHAPEEALAAYITSSAHISANIRRKLRWLPFMECRPGSTSPGSSPPRSSARSRKASELEDSAGAVQECLARRRLGLP